MVEPSGGRGGQTGTFPSEQIDIQGKSRVYRLVVPSSVKPGKPVPLVFAFHGLGDSKDRMPWYSHLDDLAKEEGFILVFPNGNNACWPLVPDWAREDLAFFDALYEHLTSIYDVDRNRVYLVGMSNGAYFLHLVASQRSEEIAAVAAHSGGLGLVGLNGLQVKHKYAVMIIHGREDPIVSVQEGRKTRDAYQKWGHEVEYVEIPGMGHYWATRVDINHQIWKFFLAHPRG